MSVYVVNAYDIYDAELFKKYPPHVSTLLKKHSGIVLAMEANPKTLEGKAKTMNAIIEFPSEEAVTIFYNDPEYQAIINLRHESTSNCTMVMLHKFETK